MKIGSITSNANYPQETVSRPASDSVSTESAIGSTGEKIMTDSPAVSPVGKSGTDVKMQSEDNQVQDVINEDMLKKSIAQANKSLRPYSKFIEREIHEVTHTVMYRLKDTETGELIAEYPPKKIQDMIAKMWELAGLVVDKKA